MRDSESTPLRTHSDNFYFLIIDARTFDIRNYTFSFTFIVDIVVVVDFLMVDLL